MQSAFCVRFFFLVNYFFFGTMKRNCVNNYWSSTMYCEKGWLVEFICEGTYM